MEASYFTKLPNALTIRGNKPPARAFSLVALKGIIMETEQTETVVEKTVAFVKNTLGIPPADKPPDVPRNAAQEALDEIRNASRGVREEVVDEKNPSYNGTIKDAADRMNDDKKVPADSEMQKAVERAKVADVIKKSGSQAEQQSDNR
jgi:hypothetical protein